MRAWYRILYPRQVVLVSCASQSGRSIITIAWSMPLSAEPPLLGISVAPKRFSYKLIKESREFVVNVPDEDMLDAMWFCGTVSGRDVDKFEELKLEALPSRKVSAPRVPGCKAYLECKLVKEVVTGDHSLFIGEVVCFDFDEEYFDAQKALLKEGAKPILQVGGNEFLIPGKGRVRV